MSSVISHGHGDLDLVAAVAAAEARIRRAGPEYGSRAQLLADLAEWQRCALGRWMLINGGWNGEWTRYCVTYPQRVSAGEAEPDNEVERFFLTQAPAVVATQQRAVLFSTVLSPLLPGAIAMSVPCGVMDDLLGSAGAFEAQALIGVDLDQDSLELAREAASARGLLDKTVLARSDAWDLSAGTVIVGSPGVYRDSAAGGVDVMTSNGLNIYVADEAKVVELYASFRTALRPGGHLIVSALTPPAEWESADVDIDVLRRARGLMLINDVKWSNLRPLQTTIEQLAAAGLEVIDVHRDRIGAFPTFLARAV